MSAAPDMSHECPGTGCSRRVPRHQLACPRHWAKVSKSTQRRVYAAYWTGDRDAHLLAIEDAIEEIRR